MRQAVARPATARQAVLPAHRALGAALLAAALAGCATFSERIGVVERHLAAGDYSAAGAALERVEFADRDRALKLMNRAMLSRLGGDYAASNADFEAAKRLTDELSALSLREEMLAGTLTEVARAYAGRPFERLMLRAFKALNHIDQGDVDGARVEALQIDLLLRELAAKRPEAQIPGAAFARYLSGIVFELGGERSDAFIAYRKAADNYLAVPGGGLPRPLAADLWRLGWALGRAGELPAAAGDAPWPEAMGEDSAELLVLVSAGQAPALREQAAILPEPVSGRLMRIALPSLAPRPLPLYGLRVAVGNGATEAAPVIDFDAVARADLDERLPAMTARLLTRQVVKSQLVRQAGKSAMNRADEPAEVLGAGLLVLGAELTALLSERADTRNWLALPGAFLLARLPVPAGAHRPRLTFRGRYNEAVDGTDLPEVVLSPGERRLLTLHVARVR
jgi:hypothetical protein